MAQNYSYPSSSEVVITGIGNPTGVAVPADAVYVGGEDASGNLQGLKLDAARNLKVSLDAAALVGQALMAASIPVAIASNQSTLPVSAASLPLPTGASTLAEQQSQTSLLTTIDSSSSATDTAVTSIDSKTPTIGQKVMISSSPVVIASDQSTLPVSAASLPLPSGAATAANQSTEITSLSNIDTNTSGLNAKFGSLGQKAMVGSAPVVIASDQSAIPASQSGAWTVAATQSGTWNITNISGTVSLPTGAATEATLSAQSAKLPATLGQKAMSASMAVAIASDQSNLNTINVGLAKANTPVYNDYTSTSITTSAYVQLIASTTSATREIEIFDSSGQALYLATGAAASEVNQMIIFPGGNGRVKLSVPAGTRVSAKALTATASSGFLAINLYG